MFSIISGERPLFVRVCLRKLYYWWYRLYGIGITTTRCFDNSPFFITSMCVMYKVHLKFDKGLYTSTVGGSICKYFCYLLYISYSDWFSIRYAVGFNFVFSFIRCLDILLACFALDLSYSSHETDGFMYCRCVFYFDMDFCFGRLHKYFIRKLCVLCFYIYIVIVYTLLFEYIRARNK